MSVAICDSIVMAGSVRHFAESAHLRSEFCRQVNESSTPKVQRLKTTDLSASFYQSWSVHQNSSETRGHARLGRIHRDRTVGERSIEDLQRFLDRPIPVAVTAGHFRHTRQLQDAQHHRYVIGVFLQVADDEP